MSDSVQDPSSAATVGANGGMTRRSFLRGVGVAAVAGDAMLARATQGAEPAAADANPAAVNTVMAGPIKISLNVNDQQRAVTVEPRTTLLSALRDHLEPAITGPKLVCDAATCGACTVLLNGKPVFGCSVLAIDAIGKEGTTG